MKFFQESDSKQGFCGGFTYQYRIKDKFQIGADVLYAQKGFNDDILFTDELGNPTGEKITNKRHFDYLSIPIKGGLSFGQQFSGFFNIGIVPSFVLDAKTVTPPFDDFGESTYDAKDAVTQIDFGGIAEIGANLKIKKNLLLYSSLAFQHSFTTVSSSKYYESAKIRNYGGTLSFGIKYGLTKD